MLKQGQGGPQNDHEQYDLCRNSDSEIVICETQAGELPNPLLHPQTGSHVAPEFCMALTSLV